MRIYDYRLNGEVQDGFFREKIARGLVESIAKSLGDLSSVVERGVT